jgi:copper oxidase (laccase) domain-containing protein
MIRLFENEHLTVALGTKKDGNFGNYLFPQNEQETRDREKFLTELKVSEISILKPTGAFLAIDPDEKIIHAKTLISEKNKAYGLLAADCPGLIVIDPETRAVGMLHLGWKEVYTNAIDRFFKAWFQKYPQSKEQLKFFLGPSICGNCFTFEGPKGMLRIFLFTISPWRKHLKNECGKYSFDLGGTILAQLENLGFKNEQIEINKECTFESEDLSSYRREGKTRPSSNFMVVNRK